MMRAEEEWEVGELVVEKALSKRERAMCVLDVAIVRREEGSRTESRGRNRTLCTCLRL